MRIVADPDRCVGHGRCYTVAPDLLAYDDEGYVTVRGRAIEVPASQAVAAHDAVASCPEQALELLED